MELRRGGICRIFGGTLITHVERGMATGPWWNSNAFQHLNRHRVRPLVCWLLLKAPIQPGNFNDSNELTRETTVKFVNRTYTWLSARVLILRVDTHFFLRDLSLQVWKNIYVTKEKREKKKRNNFPNAFDRFNKKKRIVTLKFNIYSMITLQSRTLSIILCVFKSQEEDIRKKRDTPPYLFLDPDCKDCRNTLERNKMVGQRQPWLPRRWWRRRAVRTKTGGMGQAGPGFCQATSKNTFLLLGHALLGAISFEHKGSVVS